VPKLQIRFVTISVLALVVFVVSYLLPTDVEANHSSLRMPFQPGPTWRIISGYHNTFSHKGYQLYSFDLVRDDEQTTGQTVVAGAGGTVAWVDTANGCVSINLQDNYYLMTCHILGVGSFSPGQPITQGQVLGAVAAAGQVGNNGTPHIHITLYYATYPGAPFGERTAIPFDSAHGSKLDGYDFPSNGTINQYAGTAGLQSTNGSDATPTPEPFVRQIKLINNQWPWSWKWQIGSDDSRVTKAVLDGQLFFERPGCTWGTKWLSPGSHTLEYWYERDGSGAPTISL